MQSTFAGGLIPLVLAGLGDAFDILERQVAIGRMLLAIITGQMLGSSVSGLVVDAFGWRSALWIAAALAALAALLAWRPLRSMGRAPLQSTGDRLGVAALYGRVFRNPKSLWLYGAVVIEGALTFGAFPRSSARCSSSTATHRPPTHRPSPGWCSVRLASAAWCTP